MPSSAAIRAASAFVEFSADLTPLEPDFRKAEARFKRFRDRVNRTGRGESGAIKVDLDTRAAEGKISKLRQRIRTALYGDPREQLAIPAVGKELEQRLATLLPRIERLNRPPAQAIQAVKDRVAAEISAEQSAYEKASSSIVAQRADIQARIQQAVANEAGSRGNSATQTALRDQLKALDQEEKAISKSYQERLASIQRFGDNQLSLLEQKRVRVLGKAQEEAEGLARLQREVGSRTASFDAARIQQAARTSASLAAAQQDEARERSEAIQRRLADEQRTINQRAQQQRSVYDQRIADEQRLTREASQQIKARLQAEARATNESVRQAIARSKAIEAATVQAEKDAAAKVRAERRRLREEDSRLQRQSAFAQDVGQIGGTILRGSGAALVGFGLAARDFAALDDVLRSIQGITQSTEQDIDSLTSKVRELGATTSFTANEVGLAARELARGGQDLARIEQTLPSVLNLARGTGVALDVAAQNIVRAQGQFQLAASESARIADVLAAGANAGTLDLQDLGEAFKFLGPIAETLNYSIEDLSAAFAVMANNGIRGGIAGRQLRRALYELSNETKRSRIAAELGVDVLDAERNLRPLQELVVEIGDALNRLSTAEKVSFLDDVFGEGAAAFEALSKGRNELAKINGELLVSQGYSQNLANLIDGGLGGAFRIALSVVRDFGIEVGKALEGDLTNMLNAVKRGATFALEWAKANGELIRTIFRATLAAASLGVALKGLQVTVAVITAITTAIRFLRQQAILTQFALAAFNPKALLLVAAGLGGAVLAAKAVDAAFESAFGKAGDAVEGTTGKVERLIEALEALSSLDDKESAGNAKKIVAALEAELGPLGARFSGGKLANREQVLAAAAGQKNFRELNERAAKEAEEVRRLRSLGQIPGAGPQSVENFRRAQALAAAQEKYAKTLEDFRDQVLELRAAGIEPRDTLFAQRNRPSPFARAAAGLFGASFPGLPEAAEAAAQNATDLFSTAATKLKEAEEEIKKKLAEGGFSTDAQALTARGQLATLRARRTALSDPARAARELERAAVFFRGAVVASAQEVQERMRERIEQRAGEIAGRIRPELERLGRADGEFGGRGLRNRIGSTTLSVADRALKEQQRSNQLLESIKTILRANPGLMVGAN